MTFYDAVLLHLFFCVYSRSTITIPSSSRTIRFVSSWTDSFSFLFFLFFFKMRFRIRHFFFPPFYYGWFIIISITSSPLAFCFLDSRREIQVFWSCPCCCSPSIFQTGRWRQTGNSIESADYLIKFTAAADGVVTHMFTLPVFSISSLPPTSYLCIKFTRIWV